MKNQYILKFVGACMLLINSACKPELEVIEETQIVFASRASESSQEYHTYKIQAYNTKSLEFKKESVGTYEKLARETSLKPCILDDYGVKTEDSDVEHKKAGMENISGKWLVTAVTPGVRHNLDGSFDVNPSDPDIPFLMTDLTLMDLGHMRTYDLGLLKDRRATIDFRIQISEGVSTTQSIEITDFNLVGAGGEGDSVRFYPNVRQVIVSDENLKLEFDNNEAKTKYSLKDPVYVMAGIYAPQKEVAEILKLTDDITNVKSTSYLYASFWLKQNDKEPVHIVKALTNIVKELEPQHEYTFCFNVASEYISLNLNIKNLYNIADPLHWAEHTNLENQEIGGEEPTVTVNLGFYNLQTNTGWTDRLLPNQNIE